MHVCVCVHAFVFVVHACSEHETRVLYSNSQNLDILIKFSLERYDYSTLQEWIEHIMKNCKHC